MGTIITRERSDAVTLRWLQLAIRRDHKRPILRGIYKLANDSYGCDGYRLHIAPTPTCLEDIPDDIVVCIRDGKRLHKTPGRVYDTETIEGRFPPTDKVIHSSEPEFEFVVDKEYLRQALEMPAENKMVRLRFWHDDGPMEVENDEGTHKAVIMPIHKER